MCEPLRAEGLSVDGALVVPPETAGCKTATIQIGGQASRQAGREAGMRDTGGERLVDGRGEK